MGWPGEMESLNSRRISSDMVRLVPFSPGYAAQIQALVKRTLGEFYDTSLFANLARSWQDGQIFALHHGRVVGFLISVISFESKVRILLLGVDEAWRGKGVGKAMMREFLARCARLGFGEVTLEVRVSNERAIRFYKGFRMEITSRIPAYYPDGEDGFVMSLDMRGPSPPDATGG